MMEYLSLTRALESAGAWISKLADPECSPSSLHLLSEVGRKTYQFYRIGKK